MKKKFILLVVLLAATFTLVAFVSNGDYSYKDGKIISNKYKFSVYLPTKPKYKEAKPLGLPVINFNSLTDIGNFNVFVHELSPTEVFDEQSAYKYLDQAIKASLATWENPHIIHKNEIKVDGHPAIKYKASFTHDNIYFFKQATTILTKEFMYTLSIIYPTANADEIKPLIDRMFNSFKTTVKREDSSRYFNKDMGYSIKFPSGWLVTKDKSSVSAFSPYKSKGKHREKIIIYSKKFFALFSISLEARFKYLIDDIKRTTNINVINQGDAVIDGIDAKWAIFSDSSKGEENKVLVYEFVKGRTDYIIYCFARNDIFYKYEALFRKAIKSFRFE